MNCDAKDMNKTQSNIRKTKYLTKKNKDQSLVTEFKDIGQINFQKDDNIKIYETNQIKKNEHIIYAVHEVTAEDDRILPKPSVEVKSEQNIQVDNDLQIIKTTYTNDVFNTEVRIKSGISDNSQINGDNNNDRNKIRKSNYNKILMCDNGSSARLTSISRGASIDKPRSYENKDSNEMQNFKNIVNEELKNEYINPNEQISDASINSDKYIVDNKAVFFYCVILSLGGFPIGWDIGTTGSMVNHVSFLLTFGPLSLTMIGVIIASFNVGCLIGCATLCQSSLNPKSQLRASLLVYVVGSGIELTAIIYRLSIWVYMVGRLGCGIACGNLCVLIPIYIHDVSVEGRRKNFNLSLFQTCICACIIFGNLINYFYYKLHYSFVIVIYFKFGYFILFNGLLCVQPEPPKFLTGSNSENKLKQTLKKLYKNCDDKLVQRYIDAYIDTDSIYVGDTCDQTPQISKEFNQKNKTTQRKTGNLYVVLIASGVCRLKEWSELFRREYVRKTVICCCLMGFQQLTGISYFFYFGGKLFESQLFPIVLSSVNLIGALISGPIIEKFSPRKLLIRGSFIMFLLMFTFCMIGIFANTQKTEVLYTLLALGSLFILSFSLSWGPCSGILNNIISGNKSSIIGVSVGVNWMLNCIITVVSPLMISCLKFSYGFVFCFNLLIMGLFCLYGL